MKQLTGKCLVRKVETRNGDDAIMLCGTFFPKTKIEIDGDEMWVCDVLVNSGIKFSEPHNISFSPEEFLEGYCQSPGDWNKKEEL